MLVPLCPFDQFTLHPEHTLEAVNVTFSPGQRLVGPLAAMPGAVATLPVVTEITLDAALEPQAFCTEAE